MCEEREREEKEVSQNEKGLESWYNQLAGAISSYLVLMLCPSMWYLSALYPWVAQSQLCTTTSHGLWKRGHGRRAAMLR